MINLICDEKSWGDLLEAIRLPQRFSSAADYDQHLLNICGRPMLVEIETLRFHIYPPVHTANQAAELLGRTKK